MATGHIRKRKLKDGSITYQVIVENERDPLTGKRERKYKTVKGTKKQAESCMRKMIDEIENGTTITSSTMKLSTWMKEWLTLYLPNIEESTRNGYEERINKRIIPILGATPLKSLTTANIQSWVNDLSKELAPKSVKNIYLNLKAALDKATTLRMIPYNPCTGVVLPKLKKYQAEVYDTEEINKVLEIAKNTDIYLILLLELSLGLRRGELCALTWDDVDFKEGTIKIDKSKYAKKGKTAIKAPKTTAGIRTILIGENVAKELKKAHNEYLKNKLAMGMAFKDSNHVISKADGSSYHPDSLTKKWERFEAKHNLKHIRFHDLRHSNATAMIAAGIDPKTVQTRLGHADISVTMNIYAHCTQAMNKKAADEIDKLIFDKKII